MSASEETITDTPKEKVDKLLPQKIREGLNKIRKTDLPFVDKAQKLASVLEEEKCWEIEIIECDVCVTDFYPEFYNQLKKIPRDYDQLPEEKQKEIMQEIINLVPEEAKIRVHGNTSAGVFTYCFGCESTMCGNEVIYPEDTDWDNEHRDKAREILMNHPEWKVEKFSLSGSTRNRITIDVISTDSKLKSHLFDIDDFHISIRPLDEVILKHIPEIEEQFESLKK